jgi:hypothetical protein
MSKRLVLFNLTAASILSAAGLKALWDHSGLWAYFGLGIGVAISMIIAFAIRAVYEDKRDY